jgi:LacI family transcriptional regulator
MTTAKPTIAELAARLSLSKGTVSRILNDKGAAFSEETRTRVMTVAREIGYAPDPLARALATGKTGFVALWVQTLSTAYHTQIAGAMQDALEQRSFQIAVTPFGNINRKREGYLGTPAGVDAVIAHEIYGDIWPFLFRHSSQKVPVVTTGILAPDESRDHVQVTITAAATEAVQHLASSGRKRIAYASDNMAGRSGDRRYQAYHAVITDHGLIPELIGLPGPERNTARVYLRNYIRENGCPGGIFCHNDDIAIAAYRALCDLELSVPGDCALVGCDGIRDTEYLAVPITTIVQPYTALCETACQLLQQRMDNPDLPPQRVTLSASLAIRASSQF